jgi:hypothetical protein
MKLRNAILGAALAAGLGLPSSSASAYVRTRTDRGVPIKWSSICLYLTTHFNDPPAYVSPDLALSAARLAAAAWSRPQVGCTDLELHVASSPTDDADVGNDGHSNIFFRKGQWCRSADQCYDPQALAITTVFALQDSGRILDADTEINGVDFTWGDLVAGIGSTGIRPADLQNTLTHEFGHLIGLDHNCHSAADRVQMQDQTGADVPNCTGAPPEVMEATMYNSVGRGDVERRTLAQDDTDGVCDIYPAHAAPACISRDDSDPTAEVPGAGGGSGGCSLAPGGQPAALGFFLLLVPLALGLRRRFSARRSG